MPSNRYFDDNDSRKNDMSEKPVPRLNTIIGIKTGAYLDCEMSELENDLRVSVAAVDRDCVVKIEEVAGLWLRPFHVLLGGTGRQGFV